MINEPILFHAILSLRPGAAFGIDGDTYEGIQWLDTEQTLPPKEQVLAELARLKQEYYDNQYLRDRIHNYPNITDLADAIYHQYKGDNSKMDAYIASVEAVKTQFPKSSN